MDKQNNGSQIPVNTRTIGTPEGIYILYLEDYVHTFIKKFTAAYYVNAPSPTQIALFGRRYEEEGSSILVVSGAAQQPFPEDKGTRYFPSCAFLGNAKVGVNKESGLRLEIALKNTSVILDDFYIYYDQNEEMQNYLIEWNLNSHLVRQQGEGEYAQEVASESYEEAEAQTRPPRRGAQVRAETDEAVRYGRIAQAYNRGEAKVSFIWNVMSALCLGFVVCVMAYGIISVNNYNKMKSMQDTIDYCLALVTESLKQNEAVLTNATAIATALNGEEKQQIGEINGQAEKTDAEAAKQSGLSGKDANHAQGTADVAQTVAEGQNAQPADNMQENPKEGTMVNGQNGQAADNIGTDTTKVEGMPQNGNVDNMTNSAEGVPQSGNADNLVSSVDGMPQNNGNTGMLPSKSETNSQNNPAAQQSAGVEAQDNAAVLGQASDTQQSTKTNVQNHNVVADTQDAAGSDETAQSADLAGQEGVEAANTSPVSTPQYYIVRRGDTLRSICFQVYGDYSKVDEICEWNKIEDPNNILYGQRLLLP